MDLFPDEVLLDIFDFYVNPEDADAWHTLIHVCQRWRTIVLSSPRRLNLQILCKHRRPVRKMLNIWPPLPIVVWHDTPGKFLCGDNITAALEHPDRVREIRFKTIASKLLMNVTKAMDVPFPVLTTLELKIYSLWWACLPDPFLGGSAPRLQSLDLDVTNFSPIWKLLHSTRDLVRLSLGIDQYSVTFEEIVTCLSSLAKLKSISLVFRFPDRQDPYLASQRPSPLSRAILPALTYFGFKGAGNDLEVIMAHLDAPLLDGVTLL